MKKLLILSASESGQKNLAALAAEIPDLEIAAAGSAASAESLVRGNGFDAVIADAGIPGYGEFALYCAEVTSAGIICLLPEGEEPDKGLEESGIFVLRRPIGRTLLLQAVRLALSVSARMERLRRQSRRLELKIETEKLVERAKLALVTGLKMTEPEAHRYIEKQAMDMRLTRREVAENILKIYEV